MSINALKNRYKPEGIVPRESWLDRPDEPLTALDFTKYIIHHAILSAFGNELLLEELLQAGFLGALEGIRRLEADRHKKEQVSYVTKAIRVHMTRCFAGYNGPNKARYRALINAAKVGGTAPRYRDVPLKDCKRYEAPQVDQVETSQRLELLAWYINGYKDESTQIKLRLLFGIPQKASILRRIRTGKRETFEEVEEKITRLFPKVTITKVSEEVVQIDFEYGYNNLDKSDMINSRVAYLFGITRERVRQINKEFRKTIAEDFDLPPPGANEED